MPDPACFPDPEAADSDPPLATFIGPDFDEAFGEVMVEVFWDGTARIARRLRPTDTFGPPVPLVKVDP
jgi:hypothetical protein